VTVTSGKVYRIEDTHYIGGNTRMVKGAPGHGVHLSVDVLILYIVADTLQFTPLIHGHSPPRLFLGYHWLLLGDHTMSPLIVTPRVDRLRLHTYHGVYLKK